MEHDHSSGPSMILLAIVAILGIALVAFVAINLVNQNDGTDGGGIPLPTIVLPTGAPEPTRPSGYLGQGSIVAWETSSAVRR